MFHHNPPFPLKSPFSVCFALTRPATVASRHPFCLEFSPTDHTDNQPRRPWVCFVPISRPTLGRAILGRARRLKLIATKQTGRHTPHPVTCCYNCIIHSLHPRRIECKPVQTWTKNRHQKRAQNAQTWTDSARKARQTSICTGLAARFQPVWECISVKACFYSV